MTIRTRPQNAEYRDGRECGRRGPAVGGSRECELPEGHTGPHGCTYKGEEWITIDVSYQNEKGEWVHPYD